MPTLREIQEEVDRWITTTGVRYFSPLTNMAILAEETGEVARIMARRYGDQSEKPTDAAADLGDELADVLWVICALANRRGPRRGFPTQYREKDIARCRPSPQQPEIKIQLIY